jgi:hypothetical protein
LEWCTQRSQADARTSSWSETRGSRSDEEEARRRTGTAISVGTALLGAEVRRGSLCVTTAFIYTPHHDPPVATRRVEEFPLAGGHAHDWWQHRNCN